MTQTVQWQQVADEMNCNRRGVYTNNPPTQGSSRCVCVTIHTDKNYFQRFTRSKPSRVHSTAQRCQTIIAMTPFYRQGQSRCINNSDLCSPRLEPRTTRQTVHVAQVTRQELWRVVSMHWRGDEPTTNTPHTTRHYADTDQPHSFENLHSQPICPCAHVNI